MHYYVCTFNDNLHHKKKNRQYNKSEDLEIWIIDYKVAKIESDEHTFIVVELSFQY